MCLCTVITNSLTEHGLANLSSTMPSINIGKTTLNSVVNIKIGTFSYDVMFVFVLNISFVFVRNCAACAFSRSSSALNFSKALIYLHADRPSHWGIWKSITIIANLFFDRSIALKQSIASVPSSHRKISTELSRNTLLNIFANIFKFTLLSSHRMIVNLGLFLFLLFSIPFSRVKSSSSSSSSSSSEEYVCSRFISHKRAFKQ